MKQAARVVILREGHDMLACGPTGEWGCNHLATVLRERGLAVSLHSVEQGLAPRDRAADLCLVVAAWEQPRAQATLARAGVEHPDQAEAFTFVRESLQGVRTLTLVARDAPGLAYGLTEWADLAACAEDPLAALADVATGSQRPANAVRSITRLFTSEVEDKPWFYDHAFWDAYLTELATQRFNRFTLSLGCGYDYLIDQIVLDNYLCFPYPFLLQVPGYEVAVEGLDAAERERNVQMLRYIGRQCERRGLTFRLGLWNHSYDYGPQNTHDRYRVRGIDAGNHAAYCRDALAALLRAVPEVRGLTFRVHFEGGVPEPTHAFWRVVLSRIPEAEHLEDIDFHSKGVTDELLRILAGTGKQFTLSTKFWAEHMGLPYHQASIRAREFGRGRQSGAGPDPAGDAVGTGHHETGVAGMEITHKRSFTRYGYADFLRNDRPYAIVHRVWPGTQRILTWGDPQMAAAIGRAAGFCGSAGFEWFEPLSFKGKKGSGRPGGRELYEPEALRLGTRDWSKFSYTYRLWGRLAYDPEAYPASWRRWLLRSFGAAAAAVETALGLASRVLPLVLTTHTPSAANNVYWPEVYTNIPLVRGSDEVANPYVREGWSVNADFDMEPPYNFMNTSPLDPVLVYKVNEFADDLLAGQRKGKLSPLEIASRLEALADGAERALREADARVAEPAAADYVRLAVDVRIQAGIGRFFAGKFRAALAYSLYEKTGDGALLAETLAHYRAARAAWVDVVAVSDGIYKNDITFGHPPYTRGHWADRLADIDADLAKVEALATQTPGGSGDGGGVLAKWLARCAPGQRPVCVHHAPAGYVPGQPLVIQATHPGEGICVWLHYRHVDQSDVYRTVEMEPRGPVCTAMIDGAYTDSPYPLQYFLELRSQSGDAWMVPGYDEDLSNQPYYVVNAER